MITTDRLVVQIVEPCGPDVITLANYLKRVRTWLDLPDVKARRIPMPLVRFAAAVGGLLRLGPFNRTSIKQMEFGNAGDGVAFADAVGFQPMSLEEALTAFPNSRQDKQAARVYFLRWIGPPLLFILAFGMLIAGLVDLSIGIPILVGAGLGVLALLTIYQRLLRDDK